MSGSFLICMYWSVSAEYLRVTLQICNFLSVQLSPFWHSALWIPAILDPWTPLSLQLEETTELCILPSLNLSLKILFGTIVGLILFVSHLSWIIVFYCLMSNDIKTIFPCILCCFFIVSGRRLNLISTTPCWPACPIF